MCILKENCTQNLWISWGTERSNNINNKIVLQWKKYFDIKMYYSKCVKNMLSHPFLKVNTYKFRQF